MLSHVFSKYLKLWIETDSFTHVISFHRSVHLLFIHSVVILLTMGWLRSTEPETTPAKTSSWCQTSQTPSPIPCRFRQIGMEPQLRAVPWHRCVGWAATPRADLTLDCLLRAVIAAVRTPPSLLTTCARQRVLGCPLRRTWRWRAVGPAAAGQNRMAMRVMATRVMGMTATAMSQWEAPPVAVKTRHC